MFYYRLVIPKKPSNRKIISGRKLKNIITYTFKSSSEGEAKKKANEYISVASKIGIVGNGPITLTEGRIQNGFFVSDRVVSFK